MENLIKFLIETGKLKKIVRTGWVLRGVKNPESIADHTFRMAIMAWVLGEKNRLNLVKVLKIALIHDLCEVYAGDMTPYDGLLPKNKKKRMAALSKMPRFSKDLKEKRIKEKHEKEKAGLKKIINYLSEQDRDEIMTLWLEYEKGTTREGQFVRQVDRIENLLQALEYWERDKKFPIEVWWIQLKELIDDPKLLKFVATLDEYFKKEYTAHLDYEHRGKQTQ